MSRSRALSALAALLLAAPSAAAQLPSIPLRAEVMVLGSDHMGGSGDHVQFEVDDVLAPRRQAEM
jgi:hypothetical protein